MNQATLAQRIEVLPVVNAFDICKKVLPPTKWYVEAILQEGLSLLSGDPKVGKSFFALQAAIGVASGAEEVFGDLEVGVHGPVLYLALDDGSERRIQKRLGDLGATERAQRNLNFVYDRNFPKLGAGRR